ncbi:Transcriptional Repressor Nf-X1 [Manis pentadactyla]|nr:Transcriptional Repressor Nf-X1 [Manis pentadactyla]
MTSMPPFAIEVQQWVGSRQPLQLRQRSPHLISAEPSSPCLEDLKKGPGVCIRLCWEGDCKVHRAGSRGPE